MKKYVILGVLVDNFSKDAVLVQKIFSKYGCSIRTRLGLHDVNEGVCAPNGLILLEFIGGKAKADEMAAELAALTGVSVKIMTF